jgi:ferrous iron transport protein A
LTLAELAAGERAIVERLPGDLADTLSRLGLVPGTEVYCIRRLPLGDPAVYRWRGIDLALRNREASRIEVSPKN